MNIPGLASPLPNSRLTTTATVLGVLLLLGTAFAHFRAASIGWDENNLPGMEFRQAQTAISAYFIQQENNFSPTYPTPVLGKPWSIPMEFPLYQWTAVTVSNVTGVPLTQAARGVSLACFYLILPAIWIFLRTLGLGLAQRALVLTAVLSCPLYIFYGRGFLIETMALMFCVWFAVAFHQTLHRRSLPWAVATSLFGAAAGAVKVTTFIVFLVPTAIYGVIVLTQALRARDAAQVKATLAWGLGPMTLPGLATVGWVKFADAVKAESTLGSGLVSEMMSQFNFAYGVFNIRFEGETWQKVLTIIDNGILATPALILTALLTLALPGRWRLAALGALGTFALAPFIFPLLYAWHDYYFVANAVLLMLAVGFVLAGLWEKRFGPILCLVLTGGLLFSQQHTYRQDYLVQQSVHGASGPTVSRMLQSITGTDEVLFIVGEDWSSIVPYYAHRRALMIPRGHEANWDAIAAAIADLGDTSVGAVVLAGIKQDDEELRRFLMKYLDFSEVHYFTINSFNIYPTRPWLEDVLPPHVLADLGNEALDPKYLEPGFIYADKELHQATLPDHTRSHFASIQPLPDQLYFRYGPVPLYYDNEWVLNAHAETRLQWADIGNAHRLVIRGGMTDSSWQRTPDHSDGVNLIVTATATDGTVTEVLNRHLDPANHAAHRGLQTLEVDLTPYAGQALQFQVGPGPYNSSAYDWFYLVSLTLE